MTIYVLIPYGLVTGGPDALHQMVFYLNKNGFNAVAVYLGVDGLNQQIPSAYRPYIDKYRTFSSVKDEKENIVVLPECISHYAKKFLYSKVFIWWLSVDYNLKNTSFWYKAFFTLTLPLRVVLHFKKGIVWMKTNFLNSITKTKYNFKSEKNNVTHLCASYYALDYVSKRTNRSFFLCIEPISKIFLDCYKEKSIYLKKEDFILYNPAKSFKFVRNLQRYDHNLKFVPLKGMSQEQLISQYKRSKLYIDFGPFPGAERMPKEAVLFNCAILTGRFGASGNEKDVPIDSSKYKIVAKKQNVPVIIKKIRYMLNNYANIVHDFEEYRQCVLNLEPNFEKALNRIFGKINEKK